VYRSNNNKKFVCVCVCTINNNKCSVCAINNNNKMWVCTRCKCTINNIKCIQLCVWPASLGCHLFNYTSGCPWRSDTIHPCLPFFFPSLQTRPPKNLKIWSLISPLSSPPPFIPFFLLLVAFFFYKWKEMHTPAFFFPSLGWS
jgi:hypothetical protein